MAGMQYNYGQGGYPEYSSMPNADSVYGTYGSNTTGARMNQNYQQPQGSSNDPYEAFRMNPIRGVPNKPRPMPPSYNDPSLANTLRGGGLNGMYSPQKPRLGGPAIPGGENLNASTLPNQINQNAVPMPAQIGQVASSLPTPIGQGATTLPNQIGRGGAPDAGGANIPSSPGTLTPQGTVAGTAGMFNNPSPGIPQGNGLTAAPMSGGGLTNQYTPTPKPNLGPPAIPGGENQSANGLITPINQGNGQSINNLIQPINQSFVPQPAQIGGGSIGGSLASILSSAQPTGQRSANGGLTGSGNLGTSPITGGTIGNPSGGSNTGGMQGGGPQQQSGQTWNDMVQNWSGQSDQQLHDQGWTDAQIKWLRSGAQGSTPSAEMSLDQYNQQHPQQGGTPSQQSQPQPNTTGQPAQQPQPSAPGQPSPGAQAPTVNDALAQAQANLNPIFQQQQTDLARILRSQAAVDGSINSGGFNESLGRNMSRLVSDQGAQLQGEMDQVAQRQQQLAIANMQDATQRFGIKTNDDLQRWLNSADSNTLQKYGIDKNDILERYKSQLALQGQQMIAGAQMNAAALQAATQQAIADKQAQTQLALGGMNQQNILAQLGTQRYLGDQSNATQRYLGDQGSNLGWGNLQANLYNSDQNRYNSELQMLINAGISPQVAAQIAATFGPSAPIYTTP